MNCDVSHCTAAASDVIAETPSPVPGIVLQFSCAQLRGNCDHLRDARRAKRENGKEGGAEVLRGVIRKKKKGREGKGRGEGGGCSESRSGVNCSFSRQLSIPQECGCCLYPDKLLHGYGGGSGRRRLPHPVHTSLRGATPSERLGEHEVLAFLRLSFARHSGLEARWQLINCSCYCS